MPVNTLNKVSIFRYQIGLDLAYSKIGKTLSNDRLQTQKKLHQIGTPQENTNIGIVVCINIECMV